MANAQSERNANFQGSSSSTTQLTIAESAQAFGEQTNSSWYKRAYEKLSSSRQIFCLFCVFDFVFTFFLWIIYAQGVSVKGLDDSLSSEIEHYGISSSLFDIMMLSFARVTVLLFVYGYHINTNILTVALTTFASTVYLIVKAFTFDFNDSSKDNGSRPVDYVLHIGSFLLCWGEAWYMQVKVLPKERRAATAIHSHSPANYRTMKPPLSTFSVLSFHTPPEQDSGDEEEAVRANLEYIETARKATSKALTFLYAENCWKIEKQKDDLLIESTIDEKMGKILRVRACINARPEVVHPMVFGDPENIKKWNKNMTHVEYIQRLNSTTDIFYSSIAEVGGGLISARDFVTVSHKQRIGEMFLSTSTSIVTPAKPPVQGVVRGETILNSYALFPAENERDKSQFVWIACTTLRPSSIPQVFVDAGMPGFLIECVNELRKQCELLKDNAANSLL